MKKILSLLIAGILFAISFVALVEADGLQGAIGSDILASNYGSRNGATLTNVITLLSNRACRLIIDSGDWDITNNVSFPTNVTLHVARGSRLRITNGIVVTVNGGFEAGFYEVFVGLGTPTGTATGNAQFLYRLSEWGSATSYNIGTGRLSQVVVSNENLTLVSGLTGTFDRINVQDWIHGYNATAEFYQVNTTNLLVREEAIISRLSITNNAGQGEDLTPLWSSNIYVFPATGWDAIRTRIANLPRYIPKGHLCTIHLAPGTYTWASTNLYGAWDLSYFYGGGSLAIQSSNTADHAYSTSKTCIVDVQAMSISNRAFVFNRNKVDVSVTGIEFRMDYTNVTNGASVEQERSAISFFRGDVGLVSGCSFIGNTTSVVANARGFGVIIYGGGGFLSVASTAFSRPGYAPIGALSGATITSTSNSTFGSITSPVALYASGSLIYMGDVQPGAAISAISNTTANGGQIR